MVTDPSATVTGSPIAYLAPGTSATITASHTVTQADLNAGKVTIQPVLPVHTVMPSMLPYSYTTDLVTIMALQTDHLP